MHNTQRDISDTHAQTQTRPRPYICTHTYTNTHMQERLESRTVSIPEAKIYVKRSLSPPLWHAVTAQTSTHPIIHLCRFDANGNNCLEIEEFLQFVHRLTQTELHPSLSIASQPPVHVSFAHTCMYCHWSRRKLRKKNALDVFEKLVGTPMT